jgi:hypothetical protein
VFPVLGVSAALCVVFASSASAVTIISGSANITGNVTVTPTTIQFFNGATPNTFAPNGASTGSFAGLTGGTIQELFLATEPVNTPIDVVDYATFLGGTVTPIDFDLTFIQPGFGTLAACASSVVGAECTPTVTNPMNNMVETSPFTLIQGQQGVAVYFTVDGVSYAAAGGSAATGSPTLGTFTSQFNVPGTIPGILALLASSGISGQSYSATFTATPVPEPSAGTFLLLGTGFIGLTLILRRRVHRG